MHKAVHWRENASYTNAFVNIVVPSRINSNPELHHIILEAMVLMLYKLHIIVDSFVVHMRTRSHTSGTSCHLL